MMNPSMLPIGFIFSPTDEELLGYYLYRKIVGDCNPPFMPPLTDLYSQKPSLIWQQFGGIDGQDFHCFTMLKKKKSRIARKVGSNGDTWSGENKANLVYSSANDALIGTCKRFHYENPKLKVTDEDCSWIMYEYTLDPTFVPKEIMHDSYVLCKIRKKILRREKKPVVPVPIQAFVGWPTTTSMKEYDHTPKPLKTISLENQSLINMNMVFTEEEIRELCDCNDLESTELEKHIQPSIDTQHSEMCPSTQIEFCDKNFYHVEPTNSSATMQMELYYQNLNNVELHNECSMTQMEFYDQILDNVEFSNLCDEFYDQSSNCVEPADTCSTIQMESHDQILDVEMFVKDLKSIPQQCNNVEPANVEKVISSYDNEWYWK